MRFAIVPHFIHPERGVVEVWDDCSTQGRLIGAYYWNPVTGRLLLVEKIFLNGEVAPIDTAIFFEGEGER